MDPRNPYMAPVEVAPEPAMDFIREASKGERFVTAFVDRLTMSAAYAVAGFVVAQLAGESGLILLVFLFVLVNIGYYVVLEASTGRTVGKLVAGTKVIDLEGKIPSFSQILLRTLCRYIPFEPLSVLFGERGWHDTLSKTRVVRARAPYY